MKAPRPAAGLPLSPRVASFALWLLMLPCLWAVQASAIPSGRTASLTTNLKAPTAVAVDGNGNVYVTESSTGRLYVFGPDGTYLKFRKDLDRPTGVAVDGAGRVYVCSAGKGNVTVLDGRLNPLYKLGAGDGEFRLPVSVAVTFSGTVCVADAKKDEVRIYRPEGAFIRAIGGSGSGDGKFNFPTSVAATGPPGEIVVADLQTTSVGVQGARVQVFDGDGRFLRRFAGFGRGEGLLTKPLGVAAGADGSVYVSDAYQNIVHVFDDRGNYRTTLYDAKHPLRTPLGIAVSRDGEKLYVASLGTGTVEVYGATGGAPGEGGGFLSFSTSGGGGCSAAGGAADSAPAAALALLALPVWLAVRGEIARRRRNGRGAERP